ncbi:MAG: hypothetical protein Kow0068_23580 [Marinilabiliales bacterium]
MKRGISLLIVITGIFLFAGFIVPKEKGKSEYFQGYIKYKITSEGRELSATEKAQMPSELIVYYKEGKSRQEMVTAMGNIVTISDSETKETIMLIDMMGNKLAIKTSKEENEKALAEMKEPEINYLNETKEIAGYTCKKAEIKTEQGEITAYLTEDIKVKNANWNSYKGLNGIMLEYTANSNQDEDLILIFTAVEVKSTKVNSSMFTIPAGYEEVSSEEARSMFGG